MKAITLPGPAALFVTGGGRDVDTARLAVEAAAGEHVRLVDERDDEIGLAVADPDNARLRVLATPADGFPAIDGALLGWRVERALAWRTTLGLPGPDHAYRLIHGAGDGLPGFACDVLGQTAVVYAYGAGLRALGHKLAEAIIGFARLRGAVVKLRARGGADSAPQDIVGAAPDERPIVTEHGVPFEVHPLTGLNHGLFTDMREHRRGLGRFVAGARVLNLFSYTGALSVSCARAGAATVTSVDTSAGVQAWAAGNFARSGLSDPRRWRFETGDAVRFLARAARDKERYDTVLIDPPTFSTARGAPWTLDRDYPDLIARAAAVIPADGLLWLAANTHDLGSLARLAHKGLRAAGRTGAIIEQGGLPPEYPTLAAQPGDRYLQICLLRLA
ncbi:MAG: class I SAM-dependent rRNA methyltransferase [Deltaproteobacteria bacterium]|nr:MAG: class I SAM-dependent rRNA methyltransferase [Deltaproteobacteria bacterium]TMQ22952.1 MAG: class I SAM-dependent rRNA methyltransferase [Deltaproteobacteria bacterium]